MSTRRLAAGLRLLPLMSFLCAAPLAGQHARLVKDIEATTAIGQLQTSELFPFGSSVYFGGFDSGSGEQLWTSDGTPHGTLRIRDFDAASYGSPSHFTAMGGDLYFFTSKQLWRRDGAGAIALVADLPDFPWRIAALDGVLIIQVGYAVELWRSDGTPEGTFRLTGVPADLQMESSLTRVGDSVFFFAHEIANGRLSLWSTDGAAVSFRTDIGPYALSAVEALGDRLLFVTYGPGLSRPFRLWRSDGSAPGTQSLADFAGDSEGVCPMSCQPMGPGEFAALGGRLYFAANDGVNGRELWRTDGTTSGTILVRDIYPGPESSAPLGILAAGSRVYLRASDSEHGMELWSSDGTSAGTSLVVDRTLFGDSSITTPYVALGDRVIFAGDWFDDLWITDGPSAARRLVDLTPGDGLPPGGFAAVTDGLLFFERLPAGGVRLWKTDGTSEGTRVVDPFEGPRGSWPAFFTPLGDRMMFLPFDPDAWRDWPRNEVWVSDGSEAGTVSVAAFDQVGFDDTGTTGELGGEFFFSALIDQAHELWKSDGTPEGTTRLSGPIGPFGAADMTTTGGKLFFSGFDETHGAELWVTDGTAAGTRLVRDIRPGRDSSFLKPLGALGGRFSFMADDGVHGEELWISDGTEAGTALVKEIRPGPNGCTFQDSVVAFGRIFFGAYDGGRAFGLWSTDGTAEGTYSVGPFDPHQLATAGGLIYFTDVWLTELWRSDGTTEGTFRVARTRATNLVGSSGFLYFVSGDAEHGLELWRSSGNEPGTRMVRDIRPGAGSSMIEGTIGGALRAVGNLAVFAASDGEHGVELWASDGSESGTFMVQDIAPGRISSNPSGFTASGGLVYFSADDGQTGQELWAIPESVLREAHPRGLGSPARPRADAREVSPRP